MTTAPVYVYGAGSLFAEFFNALATAMGTSTFATLLRMSMLLGGTTALICAITRRDFFTYVKWFTSFYIVFYIIFLPKVTVQIIDRTDSSHYAVDNVPMGLGVIASLTSTMGDALTRLTEKTFTTPDDLTYSKSGMVMASKLALASRQFQITDPDLSENMHRFMVQCVYWPIMLGHYSMNDLVTAPNLWGFISSHAPKSRSFMYNKSITICRDGVAQLGRDLQANIDQVATRSGMRLFSHSKTPQEAKAQILKYLPTAYGYLLNLSSTATDILQQSITANAIKDGLMYFGISTNSQTAVTNYVATRAQEQQRLTQNTLGFLASYWLPIMKSVFEAIMYGCFLFVVLLGLIPMLGIYVLRNYVYTLCWLQMWAPLYAIINLICSYYARVESLATPEGGFILKNWHSFLQVNHDVASLAGYLTISVPFIAAGLVRGMAGTMTHVSQYMGGVSQSAGSQAASEAVAGNISMGTTGMRNNSSFNFNAHQQDLTARMASGINYQLPGGESVNFMPDGGIAVSRGRTISDLGVEVNLAKSIQNSASSQADYAYSAAQGEAVAAGENYQAGMRDLYELAEHTGTGKSSSDSWVTGDSSNVAQALHKTKDLTQQFASDHQISYEHAKDVLSQAKATVSLGPKGGFSAAFDVGAGIDGSVGQKDSAAERRLYNAAEDFVQKTGYSENIDTISKAAVDHSLVTTGEKGARLVDNMGASFDQSNNLRKESDAHFQEAQSYRKVASYAEDNAVRVNVNASQKFLDYVANQPNAYTGTGKAGVLNAVKQLKDPDHAKTVADHFGRDYAKSHLSTWGKGMPHSGEDIKQIHQTGIKHIYDGASASQLQSKFVEDKNNIKAVADDKELTKENLVNTSIKDTAESKLATNQQNMRQASDRVSADALAKEQKLRKEEAITKESRNQGMAKDALQTVVSKIPGTTVKSPADKIKEKIDDNKR